MFELGHIFPLYGFVGDVFFHYRIYPCQLHSNEWILLTTFDEYFRLIGLVPTIAMFRHYYILNDCSNGGYDICWFFTFSIQPKGHIKDVM